MSRILFLLIPTITAFVLGLGFNMMASFKNTSFKILGFFYLLFTIVFISFLLVDSSYEGIPAGLQNFFSLAFFVAILALPPTMYNYVSNIALQKEPVKVNLFRLYLLPICLLVINGIAFFFLNRNATQEGDFAFTVVQNVMDYSNYIAILFAFPLLNIVYIYKSFERYRAHKQYISETYSYEDELSLKWIYTFIWGYLILLIGVYLTQLSSLQYLYVPTSLSMFAYLVFIGYKGYQRSMIDFSEAIDTETGIPKVEVTNQVLVEEVAEEVQLVPAAVLKTKKATSIEEEFTLSEDIRLKLRKDLLFYMETEKPYLNQKLMINQLARSINTNNKYLSYVINKDFNQNFVTFINSYRIEEAKLYLQSAEFENFKIEAIGNMAGFKSKSSFNTAFKSFTGKTPSAFRKKK